MTTLKVCQIGCGYWGPNLMRNLDAHPRADLAGICDIDEATRAKFSQLYPDARLYESLDDVLLDDKIEAVIIATPSGMHVDQTSRALAAKKHVLVEKPLAETVSDATKLHEAARAVDRTHARELRRRVRQKDVSGAPQCGQNLFQYGGFREITTNCDHVLIF